LPISEGPYLPQEPTGGRPIPYTSKRVVDTKAKEDKTTAKVVFNLCRRLILRQKILKVCTFVSFHQCRELPKEN
jgi:hypothetical protein